jgi:hypothetical protein
LAALVDAGLFVFYQFKGIININGVGVEKVVRVNDDYPSLVLALLSVIFPLIAIFMFKQRKKQMGLALASVLTLVLFVVLTLWRVNTFKVGTSDATAGTFGIGSVLPLVSSVLVIMAMLGIRKDEKLVKSMDRFRD